jgi:small multidrug resistance family-3 protein
VSGGPRGWRSWEHSLAAYGVVATFQPANFGRVYAAYGGVFIVLSLAWGWAMGRTPA